MIYTAPLPVLVAVGAIGWLIVRSRDAIVDWCVRATGERGGAFISWSFVTVGGYVWGILGSIAVVLWFVDLFE